MKNLKVFDLKNNPLECNNDFRNLMKFLGLRKVRTFNNFFANFSCLNFFQITLGNRNTNTEFEEMKAAFFEERSPAIEWNELARKICKRNEENKLNNQEVLDEIDETEEDYDDEENSENSNETATDANSELVPKDPKDVKEKTTKKPVSSTKAPKEKSTAKPKATTSVPPSVIDSNNENDESEADDNYDYSDEIDDDEDREDESIKSDDKPDEKNKILLDGIKVIKEIDSRIFGKSDIFFAISSAKVCSFKVEMITIVKHKK